MQPNNQLPQAYTFTDAESKELIDVFNSPLVAAYLSTCELEALIGKVDVDLTDITRSVEQQAIASLAYTQGVVTILRELRSLGKTIKNSKQGDLNV